jgi:hypothetical protein
MTKPSRNPALAQVKKQLSLPAGGVEGTGRWEWRKDRGHAGRKMVDRVKAAAKAAGWLPRRTSDSSSADGESRGVYGEWTSPEGHTAHFDIYYGPTADYNRFSITIRLSNGSLPLPLG